MPRNGLVMRFFGCDRRSVGVVGGLRHTKENRDFKAFFVGYAQSLNPCEKARKTFSDLASRAFVCVVVKQASD